MIKERLRGLKAAVKESPVMVFGILAAVVSFVYICAGLIKDGFNAGEFFSGSMATVFSMLYLVGKVINPTQGFRTDYQFIELKLISFGAFKAILALKFLWGGAVFIVWGIVTGAQNLIILGALNCIVNLWVFFRHKWTGRLPDVPIALFVMAAVRYQWFIATLIILSVAVAYYIAILSVDFSGLVPIYKLLYQIKQQRYLGAKYSDEEVNEIKISAEKLVGSAKTKSTDWCERTYERPRLFLYRKELSRISARKDTLIAYMIVNILLGIAGLYLNSYWVTVIIFMQALVAWNYGDSMNRAEAKLLRMGFANADMSKDIKLVKLLVYAIINFVLMLPIAMCGMIWVSAAALVAIAMSVGLLYRGKIHGHH